MVQGPVLSQHYSAVILAQKRNCLLLGKLSKTLTPEVTLIVHEFEPAFPSHKPAFKMHKHYMSAEQNYECFPESTCEQ